MIKAVIIGQSHTVCMADALSDLDLEGFSVVRLRSGDKLNDPNAVTIDQAIQFIRDLAGGIHIFLSIAGKYHKILGLVRPVEYERLKKWSEGLKMKYVPAPSACLNDDGFLAESYFAADATHANSKYGALVLGLVASIVDQRHGNA